LEVKTAHEPFSPGDNIQQKKKTTNSKLKTAWSMVIMEDDTASVSIKFFNIPKSILIR